MNLETLPDFNGLAIDIFASNQKDYSFKNKAIIALTFNQTQEIINMGGVIDLIRGYKDSATGKEYFKDNPISTVILITQKLQNRVLLITDVCLSFRYEHPGESYYDLRLHVQPGNPRTITREVRSNGSTSHNGLNYTTEGNEEPGEIQEQLNQFYQIVHTYSQNSVPTFE
jgi:hypothetical protein